MSSNVTQIKTMRPVNRAIYAYTTPNDRTHDGWIKIGDTEVNFGENLKTAVDERVKQQTHTSNTKANVESGHFQPAVKPHGAGKCRYYVVFHSGLAITFLLL